MLVQGKSNENFISRSRLLPRKVHQIYEARRGIENAVMMILVEKHKSQNLDLSAIDRAFALSHKNHSV